MTDQSTQTHKAEAFRHMHAGPDALLLPNAWDAISARLFEEAGFPAIATTSGGLAWSLGYRDGECVPRDEMLAATARIACAVEVPVNADIEAGFGDTPEALAETVTQVIGTGIAGINIEDGTHRADTLIRSQNKAAARIQTAREAADATSVPIVINARTDLYLLEIGGDNERFDTTLARARAYREAGADCFYPIGLNDLDTIADLTSTLDTPVNIILHADGKSLEDFQRAGVARVSCGIGPVCAVMEFVREQAQQLHATGRLDAPTRAFTHADAQALFPAPDS